MTATALPLSPLARLVIFLDSIPDDDSQPDYAKWQTAEPESTPVNRKPTAKRAQVINAA